MSKMIVLMMDEHYPFLDKSQQIPAEQVIVVRQTIKVPKGQKNTILAKANFLKNLKNKFLVKVDSIYEEEDKLHIIYEYICKNLKSRLTSMNAQNFYLIHEQMKNLCTYLANIGVRVLLTFDRLGFDSKNMVKFFMGLDFEWEREPQEDFLQRYYESQVQELLHPYYPQQSFYNHVDYHTINKKQYIDDKRRKVSFATLPSRFNRYKTIDQKLNNLKASSKEKKTQTNIIRSHSNTDTVPKQVVGRQFKQSPVKKLTKRAQDRKFSGDIRMEFFSRKKFQQKQSDIKSEYGYKKAKQSPRKQDQYNKSQIQTCKTKSRIQEMKNKEYKEIANSNKDYLKDFLSVLEEDEEGSPTQHKHSNLSPGLQKSQDIMSYRKCLTGSETSIMANGQAADLQIKAKQAIRNSLKVMMKFKTFLHEG